MNENHQLKLGHQKLRNHTFRCTDSATSFDRCVGTIRYHNLSIFRLLFRFPSANSNDQKMTCKTLHSLLETIIDRTTIVTIDIILIILTPISTESILLNEVSLFKDRQQEAELGLRYLTLFASISCTLTYNIMK